jgi:arsenical pump membrane protein
MTASIIISLLTSIGIILSVLFLPRVKLKRLSFDSYWVVALIGALSMVLLDLVNLSEIKASLLADTSINPIKILTLFISMTILSIFLDEVGFFRYLANLAHKRAKSNQMSMFLSLYFVTSILTIFTSNDIIILTFTPFICYFAKNAKISPIPYLVSEFVAANTWSMMLVIGNPTNIYLATMYNISFFEYVQVMFVPAVLAGLTSLLVLWLIFKKELKKPLFKHNEEVKISNRFLMIVGLIHLGLCTLMLSISSYIDIQMWIITLIFALSLIFFIIVYNLVKKQKNVLLKRTLIRAPWALIPFVISMFIIVLSLSKYNVTTLINSFFGNDFIIAKYTITSFLSANVINNIPMSVLYAEVVSGLSGVALDKAVYSTIIGSNLGAYLTPIGALAGIMWMSILKEENVKFGFVDFVKKHFLVAICTLTVALLSLVLMFAII